jgi:hypothetical protein
MSQGENGQMEKNAKLTWKELEAQGVHRCCVSFNNGKQCRRRAKDGSSWCDKHHDGMERVLGHHRALLKQAEKQMREDNHDQDGE